MAIRIGVDVGGTFTKAVAIDGSSGELLGKATSPTTYDRDSGVSGGVIEGITALLKKVRRPLSDVRLVVLSTTQAVNALLEGDVTTVGVVGLSSAAQRAQAEKRTRLTDLKLAPNRFLSVIHEFLETDSLDSTTAANAVDRLKNLGAGAIVASSAYGVDDPGPERMMLQAAARAGLPATAGHEMTGLYGLEVRTFTAAVNACILPQMSKTLRHVVAAVRQSGIDAPLMVMHGDLEIVDSQGSRLRPAATVLSGPAASVAGALMYHRVAEALFLEVGGTSTNIGIVRRGQPAIRYVRIMDHPTCVRSVDVHVAGVAGGSLLRVRGRKLIDVGPRSAHIAGLPYASFVPEQRLIGASTVTIAPRPGDPREYVCIETTAGDRVAVTLTDAANALGSLPEGDYARGSQASARAALGIVATELGTDADSLARRMLSLAVDRLRPLIKDLLREYRIERPEVLGLGGAASVLVPAVAASLHSHGHVVEHAEVISSIGVAMLPVGLEWDRSFEDRSVADVWNLISEAERVAVEAGADPESVQVTISPVPERRAVRVRAAGTAVGATRGPWGEVDSARAAELAAKTLSTVPGSIEQIFENRFYRVFRGARKKGIGPFSRQLRSLAVVDRDGAVRFATDDGEFAAGSSQEVAKNLPPLAGRRAGPLSSPPHMVLIDGSRMIELPTTEGPAFADLVREAGQSSDGIAVLISSGAA